MQSKATQDDVAKRAGVSVATVSYVMNGRKNGRSRIPDATKQLVLDSARELNYLPNLAARDLRRGADAGGTSRQRRIASGRRALAD